MQCLHCEVDRGQHVARGFNDARPPSRDDLVAYKGSKIASGNLEVSEGEEFL